MHLGWSNFVRHQNTNVFPVWVGTESQLLSYVQADWENRVPGFGRDNCNQVVVVPIQNAEALKFCRGQWIPVEKAHSFEARVMRRQPEEHPFLQTTALGTVLPVTSLKVVLYNRDTLLENNGSVSGDFDWEIVAIIASSWNQEPMMPLTMARNYLEMPGGTKVLYTAQQLAEAIYFWSQYVRVREPLR